MVIEEELAELGQAWWLSESPFILHPLVPGIEVGDIDSLVFSREVEGEFSRTKYLGGSLKNMMKWLSIMHIDAIILSYVSHAVLSANDMEKSFYLMHISFLRNRW